MCQKKNEPGITTTILKQKDLKQALSEAADWERILTEEESTKISYAEAKKKVLQRIFDKWKIKLANNE